MNKSIISWTTVTWNPVHGCHKVSEGCRHCYAERLSLKYGWTKKPWTAPNAPENVQLKPHKLNEPFQLKEPTRIFVNSMSDLFHELIPEAYLHKIFDVMEQCPQHVFQVLTKRPERAIEWPRWPANVWMGASVESAKVAGRIDALRRCDAAVKFLSVEPLIAPLGAVNLAGIDWVIVGGESGPDGLRREMPHAWAREIRDLCTKSGVAYFFKQSSAARTEMGCALHHGDGTFWQWHQWPGQLDDPIPAPLHRYAHEPVPRKTAP